MSDIKIQQTQFYGRQSGDHFSLYPDNPSNVKVIEMWAGWGTGDAAGKWVLKGIKLTWFNKEEKKLYNHPQSDDDHFRYEFSPNETALCSIQCAWRIDRFEFTTSKGNTFIAGGTGGHRFSNIANGFIVGFEGNSGWEIDYLSMRYEPLYSDNHVTVSIIVCRRVIYY